MSILPEVYICAPHARLVPEEDGRACPVLWNWLQTVESYRGCWEPNLSLQEQPVKPYVHTRKMSHNVKFEKLFDLKLVILATAYLLEVGLKPGYSNEE